MAGKNVNHCTTKNTTSDDESISKSINQWIIIEQTYWFCSSKMQSDQAPNGGQNTLQKFLRQKFADQTQNSFSSVATVDRYFKHFTEIDATV